MATEKRRRGVPYLDSVDLEIIEYLESVDWQEGKLGYGVLEVASHLKLNHNNLKPHIDKLLHLKLITIIEEPIYKNHKIEKDSKGNIKNKIILASKKIENFNFIHNTNIGTEDKEFYGKENDFHEELIKILQKTREYINNIDLNKKIDFDLRKGLTQKRLLNPKIVKKKNKKRL
jgi:hypothetical protein